MSHRTSTPGCSAKGHLPDSLINILKNQRKPPTGNWSDFNPDFQHYKYLLKLQKGTKLLCEDDLPTEPSIDDYTDLEAERTRGGRTGSECC